MSDNRDVIQTRLLSNVDDSYNKSQGEFMYDALKPVSIELENSYVTVDKMLDKRFADTATGKDLDKIVKSLGLTRKATTQATTTVTVTGTVGSLINSGDLVASDTVSFKFMESKTIPSSEIIDVSVKCTSYGSVGNVPVGVIKYFPKTLAGLQTVTNKTAVTNGYNEETDAELRVRYYTKVQTPATSGNKYQFFNWALEVTGVGAAKVFPLANGKGTVKVVITDSNKQSASSDLITTTYNYIEDLRPIGCTLSVVSATEKAINITANVSISSGLNLGTVQTAFNQSVTKYLESIAFNATYVSIAKIGDLLINTSGIEDYSDLKINGSASNVALADEEIAVLEDIVLGVM
ncbi:baseplate J-like protein [Clostridium saccharobutylicum]|uniref:baseplate J/gp47 family protein n=1 Tax=Clostridium saccharobutylicum TaxID=169679 RepID=UPI0009839CB7|nr:baseplate J/gp47 family protein [Clostridium saccharobutylicum]AQS09692.1 baseplate J-like protein [Clostridium saccharobutylicum]MBC2436914.1 baseplate J/gp47 family protein [Clostridium saccharobutylicum]NSB89262.1 putative phage protein gp47/JayE [Clostridium saccharobutylicum]NYC27916.1 putative phage protein gp47/JayE [Clostridium saccharobutylicum]OOM17113.1 baseplate J-like protein [Clostridium saccharobutylicum]